MNKYLRIFLIVVFLMFLIVVSTPLFSDLYVNYFGKLGSGLDSLDWGDFWKLLIGFIISYMIFVPLIFSIFIEKPIKYYLIISLVGLPLLFILLNSNILMGIQITAPFLLISMAGWLIGEGILLLYKKLRK